MEGRRKGDLAGRGHLQLLCGVLESSDDLAAAFVATVAVVVTAVVVTIAVVIVVSVIVAVAVSFVAVAVIAADVYPNLFFGPAVVSGDPDFANAPVMIATAFVVAGHPCFHGDPFPVAMVVAASVVVVAYADLRVAIVVRDDGSDDESADDASNDGLLFIAGFGGVRGDECCNYGDKGEGADSFHVAFCFWVKFVLSRVGTKAFGHLFIGIWKKGGDSRFDGGNDFWHMTACSPAR